MSPITRWCPDCRRQSGGTRPRLAEICPTPRRTVQHFVVDMPTTRRDHRPHEGFQKWTNFTGSSGDDSLRQLLWEILCRFGWRLWVGYCYHCLATYGLFPVWLLDLSLLLSPPSDPSWAVGRRRSNGGKMKRRWRTLKTTTEDESTDQAVGPTARLSDGLVGRATPLS
jgi:hypothetical protein